MAQDPRALLQKVIRSRRRRTAGLTGIADHPRVQAEKALSGAGGGFSLFGGRQEKFENAADLYIQAAYAFRMQKQEKEAGIAFERAAAIQTKNLNEPDDAASTLVDAFRAYRKTDPEDAARVLDSAISHFTSRGNFRRAATHKQSLAEVYESEIGDQKRAIAAYETAASWFEGDNAEALANKLYLKVADLAALEGDYYKSIEQYERVAKSSVSNNLMKWSVKDYFLKAGLCHLATNDMVGANRALEGYRDLDPTFASTREHQLLVDLSEAIEQGEQELFADKLFQYDRMSKLDKWKTTILLRIKGGIEEKGEDFS
ncbi:MAG: vesicular-fusion protein S17 [Thelocarpon superellum]|nr:MAG: vesicular-fusion protein S17 [Thelocarpon superellum]